MRTRITTEPDGRLCLESPYSRPFVDGLKMALPWDGRAWDPERKRWLVSALYAEDLLAYCQQAGEVIDEREDAATPRAAVPQLAMPDELRQAFDALFLAYTAPLLVAEAAYKALQRVYHPDNLDWGDVEKSVAINESIRVIRHWLGNSGTL